MMAAPAPTAIPEMLSWKIEVNANATTPPYRTGHRIRNTDFLRLNTARMKRMMTISATMEVRKVSFFICLAL